MVVHNEAYLEQHFDSFDFFDPQCGDKRVREVNMRTKRCLTCPGFARCQKHPEYWLKGGEERRMEAQRP